MNFTISRPYAFYGLIFLAFALAFTILKYKRVVRKFGFANINKKDTNSISNVKKRFITRTTLRSIACVMFILACAEISWGTKLIPVQKNGTAVSFVFDISYSMMAKDAPGGMTRLESAASYAEELLSRMDGTSVSVVIAKGQGIVAVPLTEDKNSITTLIDSLSPNLMTAEGTSLESGIKTALSSFPQQSALAGQIWLFTDGDETEGSLASSINESVRFGIPVTIIGFGSERETPVLAGDGKTIVKTALRSAEMEKVIAEVQNKNSFHEKNLIMPTAKFIDASEVGSAYFLLNSVQPIQNKVIAYEVQSVKRENLFILLAILFFIFSFVFSEWTSIKSHRRKMLTVSLIFVNLFLLAGCSGRFNDGALILQGKIAWNRKNYQQSVACFLQASEDASLRNDQEYEEYAIYGLASTYLMQNETDAALARFDQIAPNAPDSVRFAVMYNSGIIAHRKGDYHSAELFFKDALKIDSTNINAKINLELSLQQNSVKANSENQNMFSVSTELENDSLENAIYNTIRENDKNQWKNQQQETKSTSKDY
ncbi:MAG: VWA domain-containing protein [Treponema sp.]